MELPECGEVEVRLGHRALFELALAHVGVSRETRGSVIQLLSTAGAASPLHATARSKRWPSIKAGLEGIGLSAEAIGRCRQLVLQVSALCVCGWLGWARSAGWRRQGLGTGSPAARQPPVCPASLHPCGAQPSSAALPHPPPLPPTAPLPGCG